MTTAAMVPVGVTVAAAVEEQEEQEAVVVKVAVECWSEEEEEVGIHDSIVTMNDVEVPEEEDQVTCTMDEEG